jgi:selenocysteine lyase/cysteine desulfurase
MFSRTKLSRTALSGTEPTHTRSGGSGRSSAVGSDQSSAGGRNPETSTRLAAFSYLSDDDVYLDAACQSMRPQPVIDAVTGYYTAYNACGGRVRYAWGTRVDEEVARTREAVLELLALSARTHSVSFTQNTTLGLNLLLHQLPHDRFDRIVTSEIEHNSVFLPTMTAARRLGITRIVVQRSADGALLYRPEQLERAVVVVSAASNIDGRLLVNITDLVRDTHKRGGIVIIDAAQAMAHNSSLLQKTDADAVCFSAHKMYGASLGVVVAKHTLLRSLEPSIVGGGMVSAVRVDSFDLAADDPASLLEPGLQAWGEIIALRAAIDWLDTVRPGGVSPAGHMVALTERMHTGLAAIPRLELITRSPASAVLSVHAPGIDSHRLAIFLSRSGVMARSGYFCAHYYLREVRQLPPLLRFSLGLHTTESDVDRCLDALSRLVKGLR